MSQVNINSDVHTTRANAVVIYSDRDPAQVRGAGLRFNPLPGQLESTGWEITESKEKWINKVMTTANSVIPANKLCLTFFRLDDTVFWEFGMQTSEATNDFVVGGAGGVGPQWVAGTIPADFRPTSQITVPVVVMKDTGERESDHCIFDEDGSISINIGNSTLWAAGNRLNIARCSGHFTRNIV